MLSGGCPIQMRPVAALLPGAQASGDTMRVMFSSWLSPRPLATVLSAGVVLALALGTAVVGSVISAAPASAHVSLVRITPDPGAQLTEAPREVVLQFDASVNPAFATVVVSSTAGLTVARGKPTVQGAKVTQPLRPDMPSGVYRVAYRVVSVDGHPLSGESAFTLRRGSSSGLATSVPTPTASASAIPATASATATAKTPADGSNHGERGWPWRFVVSIAGAAALLAIGARVLLWDRQQR
jgi:copper resistance protein C